MGKREIFYNIVIIVLICTIIGQRLYKKPEAETIIYTIADSGEVVEVDESEELPFITPEAGAEKSAATAKPAAKAKATAAPTKITANEAKININTATKTQLCRLPGVGEATADKIIAYREANGGFAKIEDIIKVSGIGTAKYNSMKDYITVE